MRNININVTKSTDSRYYSLARPLSSLLDVGCFLLVYCVIYCPYLLVINDLLPVSQGHFNSLPLHPFAIKMQDISQPTRALVRPRYNDDDFPSNSADYLAANRDLAQRHFRSIYTSWMHAHLRRISREETILPLTDPKRTNDSPPIASIAAPSSSRTLGRRVRRARRYVILEEHI